MAHLQGARDVEQQLADLQKRYRMMEGSRKNYSEDTQRLIQQQRQIIDKIKKDNGALKAEVSMHSKTDLAPLTLQQQQKLTKLIDISDMYQRKIEVERRKVEELNHAIETCHAKSMDTRRVMGGVNAAKENNMQVARQIKVLENRLDKALVKFNEALAQNKELRNEIDNLRRERVVFDQIYKKLEKELHEKKKEMANIIEISNIAYEARDQAQNEIAALQAQADKEQQAFEAEWKELGRLIEADRKIHDLNKRKEVKVGNMSLDDVKSLKKRANRGAWSQAKEKVGVNVSVEKVQSFEEAFTKLKETSGIDDIDELVSQFISTEDLNFSIYNYLNELTQETEKLEEQIAEIHQEIDRYQGEGQSSNDNSKQLIQDLEVKLEATKAKTEAFEAKYQFSVKTFNLLKQNITNIFNRIGCTSPATKELLGEEPCTEKNVLQYLGFIEARTNQIVGLYSSQIVNPQSGEQEPSKLQQFAAQGAVALEVFPPSTGDESGDDSDDSEDEVDDRPLTRDELHAKTLRNISKRAEKGGRQKARRK